MAPRRDSDEDDDDEYTPLIVNGEVVSLRPDGEEFSDTTVTDSSNASQDGEDDKPLPVFQILVLCYARWVEPVAFFSIIPYVNKMAQENGHLADADVGFYSGVIESLFSLTQMVVMIMWGKASDRFGRRPILIASLTGVSCSVGLFGMAKTIWQMMLLRCLAGIFAGTIVVSLAM